MNQLTPEQIKTLEDAVSRTVLFEKNDKVTRTKFVNTIDPFFKGILVCDETNNTTEVIQNNQFIADIDNIRLTVPPGTSK
jgi:hypothetical protein